MDWLELKIDTSHAGLDAVTDMLEQQGVTGVMIDDEADFQSFLENNRQYWDYVDDDLLAQKKGVSRVTFYLERNEDAYGTVAAVRMAMSALKKEHPEYAPLLLTMADVADEDWENNWKQYYKPFTVGEKLIVKPSWEEVENTDGRKILEIDPASSFGTGQHHTTRLVMELLEKQIHEGDRMLDLGTGSGILSIAGLLLGAKQAVMVDIFENSVRTAKENTEKNGFGSDMVSAYIGNISDDEPLREKIGTGFDIITANIVADVIVSMSPYFSGFLKKNGKLIVSGIITERLDEVLSALKENNIKVESISEKEGWNAILCTCNP